MPGRAIPLGHVGGDRIPGIAPAHEGPATLAHGARAGGIGEERPHALGDGLRLLGYPEARAGALDLVPRASPCRHHGHARGHGLSYAQAEAFRVRAEDEQARGGQERPLVVLAELPGPVDSLGEARLHLASMATLV